MSRRFDLIVFDCDGVLIDSEPIVNRVFVDMLAELGYQLDYDATLREFAGAAMRARLDATAPRLGWTPAPDFVEVFDRRLVEALRRDLKAVPGARELLDRLPKPWCVASNGTPDDMRYRLGLGGLREYFEPHLFSARDVPRPKPAPDVFLHAARSMGAAPERCAVIDDSVPGVEAGVAAGMTVFGFARLTAADRLRAAGARVFEDMAALAELLA